MKVRLRWEPEVDDLVDMLESSNAAVRHRRRRFKAGWFLALFIGTVFAGALLMAAGAASGRPLPLVLGGVLLVAGFGTGITQGGFVAPVADPVKAAQTAFDTHEVLRAPKEAAVGEGGISVYGPGRTAYAWGQVHHVRETERSFVVAVHRAGGLVGTALFVLLTATRPYDSFPLPKRALDNQDALRALFAEHVPTKLTALT